MSLRFLAAFTATFALCTPCFAADLPAKPVDPTEALLNVLFKQEVDLGNVNINDIPLFELAQLLSKKYGMTFVINEESFRALDIRDAKERKPTVAATQLRGMTIHQFLMLALGSIDATYIIKGGAIEIVPPTYAAKVNKAPLSKSADGREMLAEPLVSAVIKEKPLNEAVAMIAERYDLTVVVSPQAGDAKTGFVTARLLNVPADKALELLAVQCDLRIVRKGNAFLITSRDHANEMFGEKMERERQMIELEKFRQAPPPKPQPEPKPEPKPELKLELKPDPKP